MFDKLLENQDLDTQIKDEISHYLSIKPLMDRCLELDHDLNNPLACIMGYAQYLLDEPDGLDETQLDCLEQILRGAERMQEVIEALSREKAAHRRRQKDPGQPASPVTDTKIIPVD